MHANHIISEFLFIIFTTSMLISHYLNINLELPMNIFYILLNISKFAESFLIMYTIRKIKKNKFVSKKVLNLNTIKNQKTQILDLRGI